MENENKAEQNLKASMKKKAPMVFMGLILFFISAVILYWFFLRGKESTEDAKIVGHIVSIAPRIEGQVVQIFVNNDSVVKEGEPLVLLDNSMQLANVELAQADFDASVASFKQATVDVRQARANFLSAQSTKELELKNLKRVLSLQQQKAISQQGVDQQKNKYEQAVATLEAAKAVLYMSENVYKVFGNSIFEKNKDKFLAYTEKIKGLNPTLDAALAKLNRAKANLDLAKLNLTYTVVRAPFSGVVANKTAEVGKNVNPNVPLLSIVSLTDTWVVANFKETQLKDLQIGDPVKIRVDTYPHKVFTGVVNSIAPASGDSFALLPPDNASGNFIKVTQRFPIKIDFHPFPKEIMRPGMSVDVTIKEK